MVAMITALMVGGNDLSYFPTIIDWGFGGEIWINHGDNPHAITLSVDVPMINPEIVEAYLGEIVEDCRAYCEKMVKENE